MAQPKILINAFLMSFCSLGYQQLLALTLTDSTDDYVLSQTVTLGLFLLGLGIGSLWSGRFASSWRGLLMVEWGLAFLGTISVGYLFLAEMVLRFFFTPPFVWGLYAAAAPLVVMIGYLTGFELPFLLRSNAGLKPGTVIAANYIGAFVATVLVPVFVFPALDVAGTAHVLGLVNFVAASFILLEVAPGFTRIAHLAVGFLIFLVMNFQPVLSQLHLQNIYFSPHFTTTASLFGDWSLWQKLGSPIRIRTPYQWIDVVPPEFTEAIQGRQDFQLYLDRKIQFSSGSYQRYHESMVHGGINLLGREPVRVLILGGGDGLLAKELLAYKSVVSVDLVEIDKAMIGLALKQKEIVRLNGGSLKDPRVHVQITDAFQFLRSNGANRIRFGSESRQKSGDAFFRGKSPPGTLYDLVLIDLPFPVNYDLSLLYTKEFYTLVRRTLNPEAVVVLDFPLPGGSRDHLPDLIHTLKAAGFMRPFAFGNEDFFVAASARGELNFNYATLLPRVGNQTLINLISRSDDVAQAAAAPSRVNSVLFPLRFGSTESWGSSKPAQILTHNGNENFAGLFLQRFSATWKNEARLASRDLPVALQEFWRENMNEPRDFAEEIVPGLKWPRFQWGIESRAGTVMPVFQWFDLRDAAQLRREWSKAYCLEDNSPWSGVSWVGDKSVVEFYVPVIGRDGSSSWRIRRYEDKNFVAEYPVRFEYEKGSVVGADRWFISAGDNGEVWRQEFVGAIPPMLNNPQATDIQSRVQREFLINPRTLAFNRDWQRIYFP